MFNKSIKVYTDIDDETTSLRINGNVIPTPGKLRQKIGLLNSSINKINFGNIIFQQSKTQTIEIENRKATEIIMSVLDCPEHIKLEIDPETITPGERGEIQVTYDTNFIDTYGSIKDNPKIRMKFDNREFNGSINITANVVEDFSTMSKQELADAPVIFFPKKSINIGEIEEKQVKSIQVEFENRGKSELIIHNVEMNNIAFILGEYDKVIKPGKKGKFTLNTNPIYISSRVDTRVTVIANDPKSSNTLLRIFGTKNIQKPALKEDTKNRQTKVRNIKVHEAKKMMDENKKSEKLVILDVRTPGEYENGCLQGALNIDIQNSNFKQTIQHLDRSRIYLVYCKSGIRSEEAITIMSKFGFENVFHMFEGMDGWQKNRLEVSDPERN